MTSIYEKEVVMLEDYFSKGAPVGVTLEQKQRLLAVQAALEIAKHSVGKANQSTQSKVEDDLEHVAKEVSKLADAIQLALKK